MVGRIVGKDPAAVSQWYTHKTQPTLETLQSLQRLLKWIPANLLFQ